MTLGVRAAPAIFLVLGACAGPRVASLPSSPAEPVAPVDAERVLAKAPRAPRSKQLDFGAPFARDEGDLRFAQVGAHALHKRHVYDRLLEVDPRRLREIEEALALDAKVREVARRFEVEVPPSELDFDVKREWSRVERAFARDSLGLSSIDDFLARVYGMKSGAFRAHIRLLAWRRKMRAYAVRYAARRAGSLRLLRFVARTREAAEAARRTILDGADFAQVAAQGSIGARARQGGRLPRLRLDMPHPAIALARGVRVGELSAVRAVQLGDASASGAEQGFAFVRVLEREAAAPDSFGACREELRRELARRPIEAEEVLVFSEAFEAAAR